MTLGDYTKTKGDEMATENWGVRKYWENRKKRKNNSDASVPEAEVIETVCAEPVQENNNPVDPDFVIVNTDDAVNVDNESGNSKKKPGFVSRLRENFKNRKAKRKEKKDKKSKQQQPQNEENEIPVVEAEPLNQLGDENNNPVDTDFVVMDVEPGDAIDEGGEHIVGDNTNAGDTDEEDDLDEENTADNKPRSGKAVWIIGGAAVLVIVGIVVFGGKRLNNRANANGKQQPVSPAVVEPVVNPEPSKDTTIAPIKFRPQKPERHGEPKWKPGDPKPKHLAPRRVVQAMVMSRTR